MKITTNEFEQILESITKIKDQEESNYMFLFFAYTKAFDIEPYDETLKKIKKASKDSSLQSQIDFWRIWFIKNNQEQQKVIICTLLGLKIDFLD